MPELPEVETVKRGLEPLLKSRIITAATIRIQKLRTPIPQPVFDLRDAKIHSVARRAKYLLIDTSAGCLIYHLGMSGSLRVIQQNEPPRAHDHVDLLLDDGRALRFNDPRRFGLVEWCQSDQVAHHHLLAKLGPEPFANVFSAKYLHQRAQGRRSAVKTFIMDGQVVVGVGNIYASESLFLAGIHPQRAAGRISLARYERLVACIQQVLSAAIAAGGTTLRDFLNSDGNPGYFFRELLVYDREGQACQQCMTTIKRIVTGQRSTYYCPNCQH